MSDTEEAMLARLNEHANYFEKLLEFIPVEVYYPPEVSEETGNRFMRNKGNHAPKLAEFKKASKKAKKARLNPANYKTVPDLQREALEERQVEEEVAHTGGVKRKRNVDSDSEMSPEPEPQNPLELLGLVEPPAPPAPKPTRADLKELRERLQKRIADLRAKRGATDDDKSSKPPRKKRKMEKKNKKQKNKKNPKSAPAAEAHEGATNNNSADANAKPSNKRKRSDGSADAPQHAQSNGPTEEKSESKAKKQKQETDLKVDVRYGELKFANGPPLPESMAVKQKGLSKKKLLEKLEKEQERDKKNGNKEVIEKKAWDKMMAKAKGEKVKDNINLLRKAVKKEEKKKKKSKQEWEKREQEVKKKQEIKQKKRNANIAEYLAKKKERRIAKRTGKKLKRPGFEGKKKKFLNN